MSYNSAITIGKFDGFHLGHQVLLQDISARAESDGIKAVCCKLRFPGSNIMSTEEEVLFLKHNFPNIDRIEYIDFTPEFAAMSPEEFVKEYLIKKLSATYVVVGTDFRFGKNRSGDTETLKNLGEKYGFKVRVCDKLQVDGSVVSSSRVRETLETGNMEMVQKLLGYSYKLEGKVGSGKKLGRTLGFPTINLAYEQDKLLPAFGVYASIVKIGQNSDGSEEALGRSQNDGTRVYKGITNIGIRPSIDDGDKPTVETFIYDFNEDIYGENVTIIPVHYIRQEQAFGSLDELIKQINKDIEAAREFT
ncbi:MAG: bifunctional riboflavin kinase/FAD synthetase [Eubacterium sp.]|nr:bifunctional riboflavin kinase/FAD synthetase [Eubacterium sp.]